MKIVDDLRSRLNAYLRGWKTNQKIIVIESDDWGSIRTSSPGAYKRLKADGYAMKKSPYCLDALETDKDLENLFDVLSSVRDRRGRPPCMTANMVMGNPDFLRIRETDYQHYYFEPVMSTLENDKDRQNVAGLWCQGFEHGMFIPQLHAREHVRYWEWLSALKMGAQEVLQTFKLGMCGVPLAVSKERRSFYMPLYLDEEVMRHNGVDLDHIITESAQLFQQVFGFRPLSTVAPNVTWTPAVESVWSKIGIRYIQGGRVQKLPTPSGISANVHFLGERSNSGCIYMVRNCTFEPAKSTSSDYWLSALGKVKLAFMFRQPAIISTHRVNYIGSIRKGNRSWGLKQLSTLLKMILKNWPDVRFISSPELGLMIEKGIRDVDELNTRTSDCFPKSVSVNSGMTTPL